MATTLADGHHQNYIHQQHQEERGVDDEQSPRETINAMVKEYLDWAGLSETARVLQQECEQHGVVLKPLSRPLSSSSKDILNHFDSGHGAQFFQRWDAVLSGLPAARNSLEVTKLEFYLHVYFSSLPMRHGHKEDHIAAMAVFRRFLETCSPRVGSCPDLLAYYALPYVPDPLNHPTFTKVFQAAWLEEVRSRLCGFLQENVDIRTQRPRLLALFAQKKHDHALNDSCAAVVRAHERLAETQRIYKTLKRKFHKLQDDYNKLIGVSSELTQALEAAVRGEQIDVETTLASCTHLFPELFQFVFSADVGAPPASILRESMERYRRGPQSCSSPLAPLDFRRVRQDLCHAPVYEQIILLQSLRWRLTHTSKGSGRQASVSAYVRGDVLGLLPPPPPPPPPSSSSSPRGGGPSSSSSCSPSPWAKFKEVVSATEPQPLAQACCRFLNALASFAAGRNYLASRTDVIDALVSGLLARPSDPITVDMILAAVQKLSIRRDVQLHLISNGLVEWLLGLLRESHQEMSAYGLEYATALLMNLSMRSDGKERCLPHAKSLNKLLADLLATNNSQVVPYVNGTLYSLMMHPRLRQEAAKMGLDQVLQYYAQNGGAELRRQLEYIIRQVRQENLTSPPPSPVEDPRDHEEDPETLEEELDAEDPVRPRASDMTGEELLSWRYSLHPAGGEMMFRPSQAPHQQQQQQQQYSEQEQGPRSYRSAPLAPQTRREYVSCPRPRTEGGGAVYKVSSPPYSSLGPPKVPSGQWDYPSDTEMTHRSDTAQPRVSDSEPFAGGGAGGRTAAAPGGHDDDGDDDDDDDDDGEGERGGGPPAPSARGSRSGSSSTEVLLQGQGGPPSSRASRSSSRSKRWGPPKALGSAQQEEDAKSGGGEDAGAEGGGGGHPQPEGAAAALPPAPAHTPLASAASSSSGRNSTATSQQPRSRTATLRKAPTPITDRPPNTAHPTGSQSTLHREEARSPPHVDDVADMADEEASQIVYDVLGESRNIATASKAPKPEDDPLFRSLPPPKASEYVVAFSSRPRLLRTPPPPDSCLPGSQSSRTQSEDYEIYEFDGRRVRHSIMASASEAPASPRSVLPPISKTNHSFTRTAT